VQTLTPERLRTALVEVRRMIFARAEAGETIPARETFARRSDGSEFPIAARHSVAEMDGRKIMISSLRDISEQQAARQKIEELNQRLKRDNAALAAVNGELEAFSYSVSHDLRTPLRAIDGFSQALVEDCADKLDQAGRSHLDRIRSATQRMGLLIDDLLKLARVTRGELSVGDVDLSALAGEVVRDLRERAPDRPVETTIAPGLTARGDARLMRVALENLLANAWKFTNGRTPAQIEFGRTADNGDAAYYVRDNGAGFDMAYAGKLFGAFQRLHDAGKFPGTGIGLATVQRVIRKHGGRIWAEAETDKGATFFFTL
jgi:light-regulated signal transduction histidine kinase (bacteriophytochrome)